MTLPFVVTLVAAVVSLAVYLVVLASYLTRRRQQPPSYLPGRSTPLLEMVWALLPVVFLGVVVAVTLLAPPVSPASGAAPVYAIEDAPRR
ncbi:MAG: hypothetical protein NZ518_11935 [Dehalococcoidia bacterium]|nr:hypothetical protein [Dehalococcoidia bacterium]